MLGQSIEMDLDLYTSSSVTVLVTGGAGYVSSVLVQELQKTLGVLSAGNGQNGSKRDINVKKIILLDRVLPKVTDLQMDGPMIPVSLCMVDLTLFEDMSGHFKNADVVIHLASYGMSGREQLHKDTIWKVNVKGTQNVIRACIEHNVKALIFTSTVNVVFGGQRIEYGTESLPYFDTSQRLWDNYGNSKTEAEKAVLQANNTVSSDGITVLRTCALRLPGIYGPNEQRHIPRVVKLMRQGLFKVTYGDNPIVEFIHVLNVCKCLKLATVSLMQEDSPAAGQAYFISDGAPINNFEFFRPLTEAVCVSYPNVVLPMWLVFLLAHLIEIIYMLVHRWIDFQPLLCRAEVYKTAQTHYFSTEKAQKQLGYTPDYQNDMSEVCAHYRMLYSRKIKPTSTHRDKLNSSPLISSLLKCFCIGCVIISLLMLVRY